MARKSRNIIKNVTQTRGGRQTASEWQYMESGDAKMVVAKTQKPKMAKPA
jgi:hypothetical protein